LIISGIDEAGLGPILGPYCAAAVRMEYTEEPADPFKSCETILSSEPAEDRLAVGDSKKIYSSGKIAELEQTVLSFNSLMHPGASASENAYGFLSSYVEKGLLGTLPWINELKELTLPLSTDREQISKSSEKLKAALPVAGINLHTIKLSVQPALLFNALLKKYGNKGTACQEILTPLLLNAVIESDKVIVDRQGGRRYYGDWLINLFPGKQLIAIQELKDLSRYTVENCRIDFQVKADALNFETALASMFAKYSREIYMKAFNAYWVKKAPGIKETAGYYNDGQRFIKDLKGFNLYPENDKFLLRRK
jgi:ribonuclease HII